MLEEDLEPKQDQDHAPGDLGLFFESVAEDLSATPAKFFKVNVDEAPEIAGRFGVQSIPTLVVLKDGVETDVRVGVTPGPALKAMVEAALA